ncbi:ribonuclease H-like domain-containing protein [Tanacetum coccineum]
MDNVRPIGSYSPIERSYYTKPTFRPKDLKQDVKTFWVQNLTTAGTRAVVNTGKDNGSFMLKKGKPEILLQDHAVVDSGCSSHMTGNKAYLFDYEDFNGGFVAFGSDPKGGKITGKGKIRTKCAAGEKIMTVRNRSRFGINKWYQSFALRNFDLEDMELESTNSGPTAKLPILKLGEYEMWAIRIKQYFQIQDYALWEVIENGDSWVSISQTTEENGITTLKMSTPATAEEKTKKKNDVKAKGLLLIALLNEHQLTFSQYPDAKSMFATIETRFGGNAATKKTQKTLLKQQYENFSATSAESLDSIFIRLQKIVIVWMNKPEIETISIDDVYNNFKIIEQKIKKIVGTSSGGQNLAFMTAPNFSSTNDANTAYSQVSAASPSDLEQIHEGDLEAMDLKWQLSLLSVECYNCHKLGHFARECRASRSKEDQFRNQDNTRKQGNTEDTSKAMLVIDGVSFDWSDMAEEQVQTSMALIAFLDSKVYTDKTCSKTCLNNYETLKKQYDDLLAKQLQTKFKASTYKRGLDIVEAQLVTYRKNEVLFSEEVVVLIRDVGIKQYEINTLKTEFEKLKQEKDGIEFKIEKFDKASKDLDQLLESLITNKSKKGLGYSTVPPPHPLIYNRPNKLDLSYSGLDEFKEPEFKGYGPENSKKEFNVICEKDSDKSKDNSNKSLVKEQESQVKSSFVEGCGSNTSKNVSEVEPKKVRKNNDAPIIEDWVSDDEEQDESMTKHEKKTVIPTAAKIEKTFKKSVRVDNYYYAKTSHHRTHKNVTPREVLLRTGLKPLSTAKPRIVNTARSYRTPINTVRPRVVNTARQNRTSVNAARANRFNVGKPQHDDKGFVDSGCSRHMTGNIAYLSDFKQFDGGYVAFGGGAYGGKISGKGTLKTANLDFEDVYFVNELKFNLFSVSQMCDKKNYVLFTDTECLVLSPNFKLPDENQILLKVPRKDNMYSFDMKNIVPKESLTCLVAKATLDESMLWHRRLGHINFKNINKLVKDNLVRG